MLLSMLNTFANRFISPIKRSIVHQNIKRKIRGYKAFTSIFFETDEFIVKTVENEEELYRALEFRHDIFVKDWRGLSFHHGLDVDSFDFAGDHLFIYDKKSAQVIGTYRFICSKFSKKCYSLEEFTLEEFIKSPGVKLELGRAAIHPEFRNGTSIDLLWKGLALYIEKTGTDVLFGCSSDMAIDLKTINQSLSFLNRNETLKFEYNIHPQKKYQHPQHSLIGPNKNTDEAFEKPDLPPLLRSYINAGARVYGLPAFDIDFACMDYLTILEMKNIHPKFKKRYFTN